MSSIGATTLPGALVLSDGTVFEGEAMGAYTDNTVVGGEVVFNTVMSGYQEVITDPSYTGQIITFTYPHIGNYGISPHDFESARSGCRGVIVREASRRASNWRSTESFDAFLKRFGLFGLTGIDTRRLTKHLRSQGALVGAMGTANETVLQETARETPSTDSHDLVRMVTTKQPYSVEASPTTTALGGRRPFSVVAVDFGIKRTILQHLTEIANVEVVPASTTANDVLARQPDGVFLSNGPGDPAAVTYAIETIRSLLGEVPIFGICLGHQLLASALGGRTEKLAFGHHGGNHPVRRLETNTVEITSQNHNYAVAADSLDQAEITHINLNDGVIEGIAARSERAFGVQYHPEAGPGPHDATYLFTQFAELMEGAR